MKDFVDVDFDDDYRIDMAPVMMRQRYKLQLLLTTNKMLEELSRSKVVWTGKDKKARKDFLKDYFKGVRVINKKNPVYIEMPTLKEVGNGRYKQVADKKANDIVKSQIDENNVNIEYPDIPTLPPS